jgi:hypothetical protein
MLYRNLGKTGIKISEIGLGMEYLNGQTRETVVAVIQEAVKLGVNYFDLIFTFKDYLDNMAAAFKEKRNKVILTGHLGSCEKNGKYKKSRNVKECRITFTDMLSRLKMDYVDIIIVHFVNVKEYHRIMKKGGIYDLALSLQEEGKGKFIGLSTHDTSVGIKAAKSGKFDIIMFPINIANQALPERNAFLKTCSKNDVGVVAMKPFAGGKLMQKNRTVTIAKYQTGGIRVKKKISPLITPAQCLNYILSQIGVSTVIPGISNRKELKETLDYINASREDRDYSTLIESFKEYVYGECCYCNHCLPCPSNIDIGQIIREFDTSLNIVVDFEEIGNEQSNIAEIALSCTECGSCMERCPFGVDVVSIMKTISEIFH